MLTAEPYRLFFPIGWIMGIVGVTYWLFVSTGLVISYNPLYHGLIQIQLFGLAFALGFLLTALPKFLRVRAASRTELCFFIFGYVCLGCATLNGALFLGQWSFILIISLLVRYVAVRIKDSKAAPPFSFFLVAFGLIEGALGAFLLMYPSSMFLLLGQKLIEQGMFLSLSLGIGAFLGPRLMGVVDIENAVVSLPGRAGGKTRWFKSPALPVWMIGAVIFGSFFIETGGLRETGLIIRATAALLCLAHFSVLKVPKSRLLVGILAAAALWSMPLGIFLAAFFPKHEVGMLHVMYIGGFGLLILTIGAQVISSHGGVHRFWETYKKGALLVAVLISVSVLSRVGASFFPNNYFFLIGIAAVTFDLALIFWGVRVLRYTGSRKL